jgi:hypothetical protein
MTHQCENDHAPLVKTINNWHPARVVFSAFINAHPELGLRNTPITFRNFCSRYGRLLCELDVLRKPFGLRSPAIADATRFDQIVFELLTKKTAAEDSFRLFEISKEI